MADGLDFSGQAVPVAQPKLPDFSAQATPVAEPAAPERIPSLFERVKPFLEKTYPVSDLTDAAKQIGPGIAVGGGEVLNLLGRVLGSKAAGYATQGITQNPLLQTLMGGEGAPENARQAIAEAAQSYLPQDVEAQQNLAGTPKTLLGDVVRGGSEMVGPLAATLATPELSVGKIGEALPVLEKIPGVAKYLDAVISQAPRAATQTAITQAANPNATAADDAKALAVNAAMFGLPAAAGTSRLARAATGAVSMPAINAAAGLAQGHAPTAAGTILSAIMGGAVGSASRGEFNPETLPEVPEVVPNTAAEAKPAPGPAPQAAPVAPALTPEDIQAAAAILGRGKAEPPPEPANAPETSHQPPIAPAAETVAPQPPPNAGTSPPERPIAEPPTNEAARTPSPGEMEQLASHYAEQAALARSSADLADELATKAENDGAEHAIEARQHADKVAQFAEDQERRAAEASKNLREGNSPGAAQQPQRESTDVLEHAEPADISSTLTPSDHAELDRLHTEAQQQPARQPEPPVHAEGLTPADHAEAEKLGAPRPVDEVAESDLSPQDQELVRQVRERQAAAQDNTAAQGQILQESVDRGEREAGELGLRGAVVESLGPDRVQHMHFVHDEDGLPPDVIKRGTPIKKGNVRYGLKTADGEIYIFTKHANTPERAVWTAWHEHGHRFVQEMVNAHPDVKVGNRTVREAHESARRMFLQNPTVAKLADVIAKQRGSKDLPRMAEEAMVELHAAAETGRWDEIARKYGVEVPKAVREGVKGAIANFVRRLTAIINAIHGKLTGKPKAFGDADVRDFLDSMRKEPEATGHGDVMDQQVFHGSPHRGIEKEGFKLNKIGTGEGAQAYGWGMYFASKRAIAEGYRQALTGERIAVSGKPLSDAEWSDLTQQQRAALEAVSRQGVDRTLKVIREQMDEPGANIAHMQKWADAVEALRNKDVTRVSNDGQLYHAEIPEDKDLLDWDKPLSAQPEGVRAKLEQIGSELPEFAHEQLADGLNAEWRDLTGKEMYQFLSRLASEGELPHQSELTTDAGHPKRAAAEWLNAQGIPGLRYLDGGSRAKGEGSHNYVIWDEAHLNNDVTPYYSEEPASPEDARKAVDELRNEDARFATADQQEAFTLAQWARHALTHGMSLDDLKAVPGETPAERIKYLADRIGTPENPHGFDTRAAELDLRGRGEPPTERQAAPVPEGEGKETAPRNAAIDEAREARELDALPHAEREHWETPLRKALAKIADDPAYPAKLAAEVATKPRSLTTEEVMALTQDLRRLNDDHAKAVKEVIKARESGDANAEVRAVLAKQQAEGALTLNHEALRKGGTEAARSLSIRNAILKEDYSLGRNMDRAKAAYGEHFNEDVRKRVEELSQRLDEQEKTIEALRRRRTQPRRQSADEAMQAKLNARIQKLRDQVEARQKACPI